MSVEIIKHAEIETVCDEPEHPIPSLITVDVNVVKEGGGSDLLIIVASPLMSDEHSKTRLFTKLRNYFLFLDTPEFQSESGVPTPDNTSIIIKLHPDSHPDIVGLLESQKELVFAHGASVKVQMLSAKELSQTIN